MRTAKEWEDYCEKARGGMTAMEGHILADLAALEARIVEVEGERDNNWKWGVQKEQARFQQQQRAERAEERAGNAESERYEADQAWKGMQEIARRETARKQVAEKRLAEVVGALEHFKSTRGVHGGPHNEQTIQVCAACDEAYVRAEAELDAALTHAHEEEKHD